MNQPNDGLIDRLRKAEAESERLREDAERYHVLVGLLGEKGGEFWVNDLPDISTRQSKYRFCFSSWKENLTDAIDAARAQEQSHER